MTDALRSGGGMTANLRQRIQMSAGDYAHAAKNTRFNEFYSQPPSTPLR